MKVELTGFGGIAPKKHPKFLNQHEAQVAENCRVVSGAIEGWRQSRFDAQLAKSGDIKTIYQMDDGTWLHWTEEVNVVRGSITTDTLERTYFTGTDVPRVTSNTLADIGGSDEFPESSYKLGLPIPTAAPTAALNGTHTTPADTAYVYTFVTGWGEEGPPSAVSNTVAADFDTGSVDLTTMDFPVPSTDYNITKYRIYRISVGTSGAEYLYVGEVLVNNNTPQYNDSVLAADLGEVMPSDDWYAPPADMIGLTGMANGMMAGFVENTIYFCEPFLPHAWPTKYSVSTDYPIVGLGSFGDSLVVLTKGYPYILTGVHPGAMSMEVYSELQPCINSRGTVKLDDGVVYRSPDGLYYIGSKGARLITKNHYSRSAWRDLNPEAGQAGTYDGRYIGFFDFTEKGIIFGVHDSEETKLRELDFLATSVYSNPDGDKYYMSLRDPVTLITSIYEFNAGTNRLTYRWRSKLLTGGKRVKITAAKIKGDYGVALSAEELQDLLDEQTAIEALNAALLLGDILGSMNSYAINEQAINGDILLEIPTLPTNTSFIVKYFVDNVEVRETEVINDRPIRLPRVEGSDHYIEVIGKYAIYEIILASSVKELAL